MNTSTDAITKSSSIQQIPTMTKKKDPMELSMQSFLQLMVAQMQNQDPMNPTSQDTYLMQMAQMASLQAMTQMSEVTMMTYGASLAGKEVTVGEVDKNGKMQEIVGTVTGVTFYDGHTILYVDEKPYAMDQLLAVGKLPPVPDKPDTDGTKPDGTTDSEEKPSPEVEPKPEQTTEV